MNIPDLSIGGPQEVLLAVFAVIFLIIAAVFVTVALHSKGDVPYEEVSQKGYAIRRYWLVALLTLAVIQVGTAAAFLPYDKSGQPDMAVKVDGYQFNWTIDQARIPAGSLVEFAVTSSDVTHGIGLYNPEGQLLASVQAMPGYTNKFETKLEKPGKYLVACLEYCGIGHHKMLSNIEVYKEKR
jgi:cytochrome c oxidase subunit 2